MSNKEILDLYHKGHSVKYITKKFYDKFREENYYRKTKDIKDIQKHVETIIMGYLAGGGR